MTGLFAFGTPRFVVRVVGSERRVAGDVVLAESREPRPTLWVGHVVLAVQDVASTKRFLLSLGLRDAEPSAPIGVVELRGGTHILVLPRQDAVASGARAPFDLMVEDLDAFRDHVQSLGLSPSPIASNPSHRFFMLREPGGHDIMINSSHVTGLPV